MVGVDLQPIDPLGGPVTAIAGDARDETVQEQIRAHCGGRVDIVLSDLAPKLSGVRDRDTAQAVALAEAALAIADRLLDPGGRLLLKFFTAPEADAVVAAARRSLRSASN